MAFRENKNDWQQTEPERPKFNERRAKKLVGKRVIIGYTYLRPDGSVDYQEQKHGVVVQANKQHGIGVLEHGTANTIWLPPDLRSWKEARAGTYKLRSTGESVKNPDFLSTWTVTAGGKGMKLDPSFGTSRTRTFNYMGFGTSVYGRADVHPDGSYTATIWIIIALLPIYPLGSLRIQRRVATPTLGAGVGAKSYASRIPLNKKQVLRTYLYTYSILIALILIISIIGNAQH